MENLYCPMIHGGLNLDFKGKTDSQLGINHCCLSTSPLVSVENKIAWSNKNFLKIRETNNKNVWDKNCWECEKIEQAGYKSFRKAMIEQFGFRQNLSGPLRIDFLFDRSCNLACTICFPQSSTLWQQYAKQNFIKSPIYSNSSNVDNVVEILKNLDLSNLEQVQFCGGETLLGNSYWRVAEILAELVPNCHNKLQVAFQTNGTQSIDEKYYRIIEKFKLVKFFISIDGVGKRFDYLRWPGNWDQVTKNIFELRRDLPYNVMFSVSETLSNFSLFYAGEVLDWVSKNFSDNKVGDKVDHSTQLVIHDYLNIETITQEYFDAISGKNTVKLLPNDWHENPTKIKQMLNQSRIHDSIRGVKWQDVFPDIVKFYSRYL